MRIIRSNGFRIVSMDNDETLPLSQVHPFPWRIEFNPRFKEWHEQSRPIVVDADGVFVFRPMQTVGHPGLYDDIAIQICKRMVETTILTPA